MKAFIESHFDKLTLLVLFLFLVIMHLHLIHRGSSDQILETLTHWADTVLGALLMLITGRALSSAVSTVTTQEKTVESKDSISKEGI